jgi:hypothetical protein
MGKITFEKIGVMSLVVFAFLYLREYGGLSYRESLSMLLGGLMMFAVQDAFDDEDYFESTMEGKSDETH